MAEARQLRSLLMQPENVVEELDGILQRLRNIAYEVWLSEVEPKSGPGVDDFTNYHRQICASLSSSV